MRERAGGCGEQRLARPRAAAALRRHGERDLLGRDERAVRGRDPRPPATRTFTVEGHHYALLLVDDLEPGIGDAVRRSPRRRARLAAGRRPSASRRPHARTTSGACGWSSARAGSAAPQPTSTVAPWPDELVRTGVDALWTYAKLLQRGEAEWPDALLLLGDQVYADEVSPATLEFIRSAARHERAAGRADRRLRGVHAPLPRVVVGPGHPLAALDRADRDDLRRPRRQRRLEHLLELGRGDAREAVVGRADHRRLHGVLDLPAHRQPLAARARRGADARPRRGRRRRRARVCGGSRTSGTASRRRAAGPTTATSATRGSSSLDSRAARVLAEGRREMVDEEEWDWIVDHSLRRVRPSRDREHAAGVPAARHPPPRGLERGAVRRALGQRRPRG